MTCAGFSQEAYAFYALGLLTGSDREELAAHLHESCSTCAEALKSAVEFWCVFGLLTERLQPGKVSAPSPELRNRILHMTERTALKRRWLPVWGWTRYAAAAALITSVGIVAWDSGRWFGRRDVRRLENTLSARNSEVERLQRENLQLRTLTPAPQAPVAEPVPQADPAVGELRARLKAAQDSALAQARELADERARLSALEKEIAEKNESLQALARNREAAEQKLRDAAAANSAEAARTVAQRTAEANSLRSRIRDLELQVAVYQRTVQLQQERLDSALRLATLLRAPSATLVRLAGTQAGRSAAATALVSGNAVVFFASHLPPLPANRTYQLWLIRKQSPAIVSAGTFSSWGTDAPAVEFRNAAMTSGISALAVTEEPAGGSPLPTGHKILIGTPPA